MYGIHKPIFMYFPFSGKRRMAVDAAQPVISLLLGELLGGLSGKSLARIVGPTLCIAKLLSSGNGMSGKVSLASIL
jgi:hypothetical protein